VTREPTTPVVMLPNGNIAYYMITWWREIGPDGRDWGNLIKLPPGSVPLVPKVEPMNDSLWSCFRIPTGAGPAFRPLTPWRYVLLVVERVRLRRSERRHEREGGL
jgi:hypothetical protein